MLAAQKQIKDRQQVLNFTVPPTSAQQRLAELRGRIASQLGKIIRYVKSN